MIKQENASGTIYYTIEGNDPGGVQKVFAVTKQQIEAFRSRESYVPLIQLMNIVSPGLIRAEHIFCGLNRPLCYGENQDGANSKLIYTWKAQTDYDWEYGKRFDLDGLTPRPAPHGRVYAVITTPNQQKELFPEVDYWIDRWYWLHEDSNLGGAPIGYQTRYQSKLK